MSQTVETGLLIDADPIKFEKAERYLQAVEAYLNYRYDLPPEILREDNPDYDKYMCRTSAITGAMQYIDLLADSGLFLPEDQVQMRTLAVRLGEIAQARRVGMLTPADQEDEVMRKTAADMTEIKNIIQEAVAIGRERLENYLQAAA